MAGLLVIMCLLALPLLGMSRGAVQVKPTKTPKKNSSAGNPYDIIALVNQIRASNGLAPFQSNGALMASAQAHSQYQASIGSATHVGSGGSDVKTRALAAGYGGGANVSVIENIYSGMNATPQRAVSWWQGDPPHLATILSTRHTDAGAGIAVSGEAVYITLDVGSVVGGSAPSAGATSPSSAATPGQTVNTDPATAGPTALAFNPVLIATPNPDGSVVHQVQPGQTLWTIAASYKISLPDLLQLNGFTENSYIFPGDKILIKPASEKPAPGSEPTSAPEASQAVTAPAGPDAEPAAALESSLPQPSSVAMLDPPAHPAARLGDLERPPNVSTGPDPLLLLILGLMLGGAALFVAGNVIRRKSPDD